MTNVVNFPTVHCAKGRQFYGGRSFETKQDVIDSMSDRDWRRTVQWESRHHEHIARNVARTIARHSEKQA
jgi:hypothetical protein